jgi:hypothetical protein
MQTHDYAFLALAAVIAAAAILISPKGSASVKQPWMPGYGLDLSGINRSVGPLPEEEFPAH